MRKLATDEIVAAGSILISAVLIVKGDTAAGVALFTMIVGYTLGRQRNINGELAKMIADEVEKKHKK